MIRPCICFKSKSGRDIQFVQFHVCVSRLNHLSGGEDLIREDILGILPKQIAAKFGRSGVIVEAPPLGELPALICFLHLEAAPLGRDGDFSSLVVVWFTDKLPLRLTVEFARRTRQVDWDSYALDGRF